MTEHRRLAAIVSADVAGYSRLMGRDESGTLAAMKAIRQDVVEPAIASHGGRIVKTTGDGLLLEFQSVVNAVRCAVEVQTAMADRTAGIAEDRRIAFRIGINLGDIIVEGDDIFGDGVNVAARLEEIAPPGGVCISSRVHDDVRDRLDTAFNDGGTQTLKNIIRPVQVWRWEPGAAVATAPSMVPTPLPMPDKPSIAVLPFQNMSGDPEQEYFADGMVEEIIAALSRVQWLFVISRNSTFTYKDRHVDIKQVGRDLGVRYVLEGSVRKAGQRIRINGQLIDAASGMHLWAERFEGALDDVFALQDRVTASVVGAIAPKLEFAEIERTKRKPTESLTAYDFYLRGLANMHQDNTREATDMALEMLSRSIEIDHDFASALGLAARCYARRKANGWMVDRALERAEGERLARRASVLAKDDAVALCSAGFALAMLAGETENGAELIDRALAIDPNMARGWHDSGLVRLWLGQPDVALEHNSRAIRLSPLDPLIGQMQTGVAHAHFVEGRYEEASLWTGRAMRSRPNWLPSMILATANAALSGKLEDAQNLAGRLHSLDPTFRISSLRERLPFSRPEYLAPYEEGLRLAGLPE
ncbi:adenylate cyclase [Rhodospirillales bacterium URHD0017]|nr:adenylate cyclase [Rhodospirillales bacterium URHD0017]